MCDLKRKKIETSNASTSRKVFTISYLLVNILTFLNFYEILQYRRINLLFNKELFICYKIVNYSFKLFYNSSIILSCIKRDVCPNHESFAVYYLQTLNYYFGDFMFVPIHKNNNNAKKENQNCTLEREKGEHGEHKEQHLVDIHVYDTNWYQNQHKNKTNNIEINCTKRISQKIIDIEGNGIGHGDMDLNLFKHLNDIMNNLRQKTTKLDIKADMLILANMYEILPIKKILFDDATNKITYTVTNKNVKSFTQLLFFRIRYKCKLGWFWQNFHRLLCDSICVPSLISRYRSECKHGYPGFLESIAFKNGNFALISQCINKINIIKHEYLYPKYTKLNLSALLPIMALYLENDLFDILEQSMHMNIDGHGGIIKLGSVVEMLLILLQPKILIDLQKVFISLRIPFVDNNNLLFDLIANEKRYHPSNRIKFLKHLSFVSFINASDLDTTNATTPTAIRDDTKIQRLNTLIVLISQLFDNFEQFRDDWCLNCYQDLKNNIDQQKHLHEQFRICIQALIGLCGVRSDKLNNNDNDNDNDNGTYINYYSWPRNEKELLIACPTMIQVHGESQIAQYLSCVWFTEHSDIKWSFPLVTSPYNFFLQLDNL